MVKCLTSVVAVLLAMSGVSVGQTRVSMQIASPLADPTDKKSFTVMPGTWLPLAVTLMNQGAAAEGVLSLRLDSSALGPSGTRNQIKVKLPPSSKKRYWLYGEVNEASFDQWEVQLSVDGTREKRSGNLVQAGARQRILLSISDQEESISSLSGRKDAWLQVPLTREYDSTTRNWQASPAVSQGINWVISLSCPPDLIPDRWVGLSACSWVILQSFAHHSLLPSQVQAIGDYVATGGYLLVMGGSDWQKLRASPLAELWPGLLTGVAVDAALRNQMVTTFFPRGHSDPNYSLGSAPLMAATVQPREGSRQVQGVPGAWRRSRGAGQVILLTYSLSQPPFIGWVGEPLLWKGLLALQNQNQVSTPQWAYPPALLDWFKLQSQDMEKALADLPQIKTPPLSTISLFLLAYLTVLVPINYLVLRLLGRPEWVWVTIPCIVAGFSILAFAGAIQLKGTAILARQISVVQGDGRGALRADTLLWVFSPSKERYTVTSATPRAVVRPLWLFDREVQVLDQGSEEGFVVPSIRISMWDYRSFLGTSSAYHDGVIRVIRQSDSKLLIVNNSKISLSGTAVRIKGRLYTAGEVPAGRSETASLNGPQGPHKFYPTPLGWWDGPSATNVKRLMLDFTPLYDPSKSAPPVLVGWSQTLPLSLRVANVALPSKQMAMWVLRLPELAE